MTTHETRPPDGGSILLLGHGLLSGPGSDATGEALATWAQRRGVVLQPLPAPAFLQRGPDADGRPSPPQVAERLAELDDLEEAFERIGEQVRAGRRVLGLAVPAQWLSNRSGRAWVERVRGIAASIGRVQLAVWSAPASETAGGAGFERTLASVRPAS